MGVVGRIIRAKHHNVPSKVVTVTLFKHAIMSCELPNTAKEILQMDVRNINVNDENKPAISPQKKGCSYPRTSIYPSHHQHQQTGTLAADGHV